MQAVSASMAHLGQGFVQLPAKLRKDWIKPLGFHFCPGLFYKWAWLSGLSSEKIDSGCWTTVIYAVGKGFSFIFKVKSFFT